REPPCLGWELGSRGLPPWSLPSANKRCQWSPPNLRAPTLRRLHTHHEQNRHRASPPNKAQQHSPSSSLNPDRRPWPSRSRSRRPTRSKESRLDLPHSRRGEAEGT